MATYDAERRLQMFSIDRAFHNEAVDATHLADSESRQVEGLGVVADDRLTLANLVGMVFASNHSRWVLEAITTLLVLCKPSSESER